MGFICEVDSKICGVEKRYESVILYDKSDSDDKNQMFFCHDRSDDIRDKIANSLMERAGQAFSRDDYTEAKRLKRCAEDVRSVELFETRVASVEVTKSWLKDLHQFISENENVFEEDV